MKKVLSFVAIAAISMFVVSCGNDEAAKKMADSLRNDSMMKANMADSSAKAEAAKHMQDSTMSANNAKHVADSTAMADSMANAAKKPGAKKPAAPKSTTTTPKVGGTRPGANK